ncbi:SDR family NAD(P)-dependent oxidoreductase [Cohaesibacter gelatinilyticus]|uniref:NAD(P)-dependent dehydrogenase, short-chain alcohol dehydrogenase family n=1 Tax=Cohaesibacter gelatinilyticus TaxID=372072 RepID=A0A285PF43_9HYPH|nr:SDR family NAD(P)-dependent oxidoreductase [Cohaesibacter gelatinilyticus]SNZ20334.1 NAD(P)-dependent dehydrogenase, short-chain alcohol dehydrogenase family [Cohaesibacter gelatinilyticus]
MTDDDLDLGKHAFVTGGGSGVGATIAQSLAENGYAVTIMGRNEAALEDVANGHEAIGWVTGDVTDPASVQNCMDQAINGAGPICTVIANAGAAKSKPFKAMTIADLDDMLSVNLKGVFNCFQTALPHMEKAKRGRMIAIASTAGLKGYPYVSGYCAAKHGAIGLVKGLAVELAKTNITVNAICPGFIETPMLERSIENIVAKTGMSEEQAAKSLRAGNPQDRFIQTDEIAASVLWLCSDAARSVNGAVIPITGGEI